MHIFMFKQKQIKKIVSEHLTRKVRIHQTNLKKNRRITSRLKKMLKNLTIIKEMDRVHSATLHVQQVFIGIDIH